MEGNRDLGPTSTPWEQRCITSWLAACRPTPSPEAAIIHEQPDPLPPAVEAGKERFSRETLEAIDRALSFRDSDRPQTVGEWRDMLTGRTPAFDQPEPEKEVNIVPAARSSHWGMLAVVVLTVLLAGGSFYYTAYLMPRDESRLPGMSISTTRDAEEISTPVEASVEDSLAVPETTRVQQTQDSSMLEIESDATLEIASDATLEEAGEPVEPEPVINKKVAELEAKRKVAEAQAKEAARQQDALVQDLLKEAEKDFEAGRFVGAR